MDAFRLDPIACVPGDLTAERVDAIVNAANTSLRGGGGVDGAIHRAAGPGLLAECVEVHPGGCPTGEARLTDGHDLPARYVIHTPGPRWRGGAHGEGELLAACYRNCVRLAAEKELTTLAFPAISTGIYGYPHADAARVSLRALGEALREHPTVASVRMVFRGPELLAVFAAELARLRAEQEPGSLPTERE